MALTIGICDDNPQQVELLNQYLNSNDGANKYDIIKSTDPEEFLELLLSKKPQLVFLDIDMGRTSGIRLGEKIKEFYPDTALVFITAYEKYALEAFGVRAFHYLLKPLTGEVFSEVLAECIRHIENASAGAEKALTVKTKQEVVSLSYGDIIYFEKIGHRIKIHTGARDYYYYENFSNLLGTVGGDYFIQCHQGYIANISKLRGYREKTLFLEGDDALPVSRSYIDGIKKVLAERLFAGKDDQ